MGTALTDRPKVLIACPTWTGGEYALKPWADAVKAQVYDGPLSFFRVDNSEGPQTGGNLHYLHLIRGQDIPAVWQQVRFPALWDTLELSWRLIVEHAHEVGADFIFSVEHDVIIPPDATAKMVRAAFDHGTYKDGRGDLIPAVVTQRYHPRGQSGIFWWDTLGCSLFPVAPLHKDRDLVRAMYETEVFLTTERYGHPRYRPGKDDEDLFIPEHLKDPDDPYNSTCGATPAQDTYRKRVINHNVQMAGGEPLPEKKPEVVHPPDTSEYIALVEQYGQTVDSMGKPCVVIPDGASVPKLTASPATLDKAAGERPVALGDVDLADDAAVQRIQDRDCIRLNLGSDRQQISGFLAVDFRPEVGPDVVADVKDLSMFADDSVEEVLASHVLEHLTWEEGLAALKEWMRVMKPGAMLTVAVPDIVQIYHMMKHGQRWGEYRQPMDQVYVQATAFGAHLLADAIPEMRDQYGNVGHQHKSIYLYDMLVNRVIEAGYVLCHEVAQCFLRPSALGETMVQGRKPFTPQQGE